MTYEQAVASTTEMVTVTSNDYSYQGWLACVLYKRSGEVRCVVEDENKRLFIHNLTQLKAGW